jgi:hypothetical protein
LQLLRQLIDHRGQVLSRERLLARVWHDQPFIGPRTVDVHIAWLRQKLEENPWLALKKGISSLALRLGLRFFGLSPMRPRLRRAWELPNPRLNPVPRSHGTDDAIKYSADDAVGFLQGHPNGLVTLFDQIGPGHLGHNPRRLAKKNIAALCGTPDASEVPGWPDDPEVVAETAVRRDRFCLVAQRLPMQTASGYQPGAAGRTQVDAKPPPVEVL